MDMQPFPHIHAALGPTDLLVVALLRWSVGENGPGGTLARAGLDLLDAWSDGNATPHDRSSPLEEAMAVTLAETRPFLQPFLSRF